MTIECLKYFITAANTGSFSEAAAKLFISPQGLSQGIRRMEEELNLPLFHRNAAGTELTANGKEVYRYASDAIDAINRIYSYAANIQDHSISRLRCAIMQSPLGLALKTRLRYLCDEEDIECQIVPYETIRDVRRLLTNRTVDIAFLFGEAPLDVAENCRVLSQMYSQPIINKNSPLAEKCVNGILTWPDLDGVLVVTEKANQHKDHFNIIAEKYSVDINTKYCYSIHYCLELIKQNPGIVFFAPRSIQQFAVKDDALQVAHLLNDPIFKQLYSITSDRLQDNPIIDSLLQKLGKQMSTYSPI